MPNPFYIAADEPFQVCHHSHEMKRYPIHRPKE